MVDDSEWEERLGRAEERYLKMCIEMDEGQPNDNDSGWEQWQSERKTQGV